ncbi:hypothetical protein QF010_002741 [Pseudomonas silensiensis]
MDMNTSSDAPLQPTTLSQRADPAPTLVAPKIPVAQINGGLRFQDLNDPTVPVHVTAVGYPGIALNDRIELVWDGATVDFFPVNQGHIDSHSLTFAVLPQHIVEGDARLFYRVTTFVGSNVSISFHLDVLVKTTIPGDPDPDPSTPTINERLFAPSGIPPVIGDTEAANGLTVTLARYAYIAANDIVTLFWGGSRYPIKHTIVDINAPIAIRVEPDVIVAPGDGPLIVRYEIRDRVNNWSLFSLAANTDIEAGGGAFPAPRVLDALGDDDLNLAELGSKDARIALPVYPNMADKDHIILTWNGQTSEGTLIPEVVTYDVVPDDLGFSKELPISNSIVRAIGGGEATVLYEVQPLIGGKYRSRRKRVTVSGQAFELAPPSIEGITGPTLDPALIPATGATVIIAPYGDLMQPGDRVYLTWAGETEGGSPLIHTDDKPITGGSDDQPVRFLVPKDKLSPLVGGRLNVSYKVVTFARATLDSPPLELTVLGGGALLPKPSVDYATADDVLDPALVPPVGTKVRIAAYDGMADGDKVTFFWQGATEAGSTSDYVPINAAGVGQEVKFDVELKYVTANLNNTVQVRYEVLRANGKKPGSFTRTLQVGAALSLPAPDVKEAAGSTSLNPIAAKDRLTIVVPHYTGMLGTDKLSVTWAGTAGEGSHTSAPVEVGSVGIKEVPIPNSVVAFNLGKPVTVSYTVIRNGTTYPPSETFTLNVLTLPVSELKPPLILQAANNGEGTVLNLSDVTGGATTRSPSWPLITTGQYVWLDLEGFKADGTIHNRRLMQATGSYVNQAWINQGYYDVTLPYDYLKDLGDGKTLTMRFKAALGKSPDDKEAVSFPVRTYTVSVAVRLPVATFKEASGAQQDQLNPDDVFPLGATVIIPATARLKTDDDVVVTVEGKTITTYPHRVLPAEAGKELSSIKVPHALIEANDGLSINLSYLVKRKAGGTDGPSDPTVYDVRKVIGSGILRVMGARANRSNWRVSSASRLLSAFNATTGQPLEAHWKYPEDSEWTAGTTWRDTAPQLPLQVRTADDQITLNAANIIGNEAAFVAHRDRGDVVGWGRAEYGATIPAPIIALNDIVEVSCTGSAYAARRANGIVVVWGLATYGGNMGGVSPQDFVQVIGNDSAFAGIKNTRQVVAWGYNGGTVPTPVGALTDVVRLVGSRFAFVAQRATGQVMAWGAVGGSVPSDIAALTDIQTLLGSQHAFAALRANGRLVAWGEAEYGGTVPANIAALTDIIELSCATYGAFTARRATGQIVAWGPPGVGGTLDPWLGALTDIVEVTATAGAFVARRANGSVVGWGSVYSGGIVPAEIAALDDIVQVCGTYTAFAALRQNGTVVAWGDPTGGGDTSAVVSQLTNVRALYSNDYGFTALTADGRVVTWGYPQYGGDSSAVQDRLVGQVSYQASPASRGLALKASRCAALNETPPTEVR